MKQQEVHLKQQVSHKSLFLYSSTVIDLTLKVFVSFIWIQVVLFSSCHCTRRSLKSSRQLCPRATRSSPHSNRRWRRWGVTETGRKWGRFFSPECDGHVSLVLQMTKKIKKLEKETAMYRSRWESSNKALVEMSEEVKQLCFYCFLLPLLQSSCRLSIPNLLILNISHVKRPLNSTLHLGSSW